MVRCEVVSRNCLWKLCDLCNWHVPLMDHPLFCDRSNDLGTPITTTEAAKRRVVGPRCLTKASSRMRGGEGGKQVGIYTWGIYGMNVKWWWNTLEMSVSRRRICIAKGLQSMCTATQSAIFTMTKSNRVFLLGLTNEWGAF